jgi:hypothetical protein
LFEVDVPLVTKKQWSALKMRAALRSLWAMGPVWSSSWPELVDRVADVGAQHVLAEELVEHAPCRALQEGDPAGVARAMPGVRAVLRVLDQGAEERRRDAVEVALGLADDVPGDELRRVLEHVDEAVQLAQDVVRQVLRGAGLAVEVDRDVGVLPADLLDELAQVDDRRRQVRVVAEELLVVDREDEGAGAALLLGELREVAVARRAENLEPLRLDRRRERADAEPGRVLALEILVDDDDRELETELGRHWSGLHPTKGVGV